MVGPISCQLLVVMDCVSANENVDSLRVTVLGNIVFEESHPLFSKCYHAIIIISQYEFCLC